MNRKIDIRNINSLSGKYFYVPGYQRGYRWTSVQAVTMLEDFKEFLLKKEASLLEKGEFYCLQPIVVKPRIWTDNGDKLVEGYELIDGQQRLTTLFLILKAFPEKDLGKYKFASFSITYQTRNSSSLERIGTEDFDVNADVDSFYLSSVYNAIKAWLENNSEYEDDIAKIMLSGVGKSSDDDATNNVRLIWYEVDDQHNTTNEDCDKDSIEIFTRLNVGKIPLNNAELIKALFLRESNFTVGINRNKLDREQVTNLEKDVANRQFHMAEEWNSMEHQLQDPLFWYFLVRSNNRKEYPSRIEFIFDLIADRKEDSEDYHTFYYFNKLFDADKNDPDAVKQQWASVKRYFRELEYWFADRHLFHMIGFLIEAGVPIKEIMDLKYEQKDPVEIEAGTDPFVSDDKGEKKLLNKDKFLQQINRRIKWHMKSVNVDTIEFKSALMRDTLLLFNILTVADCNRSDVKFPFDKYKLESWDKEHIASQTDQSCPTQKGKILDWLSDMILYFCGCDISNIDEKNPVEEWLESAQEGEKKEFVKELLEAWLISKKEGELEKLTKMAYNLWNKAPNLFEQRNLSNGFKDKIGNMALLNASINRSYQNALFPVKRLFIKENDIHGVFVPIATKNVFLKYYSKEIDNMMYWGDEDAISYTDAIYTTLERFLTIKRQNKK